MTAGEAYKAMLREQVGPALRQLGLKGSGRRWSLTTADGDQLIVGAQASSYSSQEEVSFTINLGVLPEPWWAWRQRQHALSPGATAAAEDGLWQGRLGGASQPPSPHRGVDTWWSLHDDVSARECGQEVVERLSMDAVPRLRRLLERPAMIQAVLDGDLGFMKGERQRSYFDLVLPALLVDQGPDDELEATIRALQARVDEGEMPGWEDYPHFLTQRLQAHSRQP